MFAKLKLALACMLLLASLASINSAQAFEAHSGRGTVARILDFVVSLLEPAVFDLRGNAQESAPAPSGGAPAQVHEHSQARSAPAAHRDWMPFASIPRLTDDAQ